MLTSENPVRLVREIPPVADVHFDDRRLYVELQDGRQIGVPLAWFPILAAATPEQRNRWEPLGRGVAIHWPDLDEDIAIAHLLGVSD